MGVITDFRKWYSFLSGKGKTLVWVLATWLTLMGIFWTIIGIAVIRGILNYIF